MLNVRLNVRLSLSLSLPLSLSVFSLFFFYYLISFSFLSFSLLKFLLLLFWQVRARLVCVFKNWKLLFKNIYENTCGWKSALKCVKCCLKTENGCLKTQTKYPLSNWNLGDRDGYGRFFVFLTENNEIKVSL